MEHPAESIARLRYVNLFALRMMLQQRAHNLLEGSPKLSQQFTGPAALNYRASTCSPLLKYTGGQTTYPVWSGRGVNLRA
jgi:hypothetical protein